jgi:hypothetical protein
MLRHHPDNLAALADHDLRLKRKAGRQFGAELCTGDRLPENDSAGRADVDRIEVLQLCGEHGGSEGPVATDIDPSQEDDECHEFPRVLGRNLRDLATDVSLSGS